MVGVAAGEDVQVDVIAYRTGGNDWILLVLCCEILESLVLGCVDNGALLDPADLVLVGLHPQTAATVLEHLKGLPIDDFADAIRDGRDTIVEIHLSRGNVHHFMVSVIKPFAAGDENEEGDDKQTGESRHKVPG